MGRYLELAKKAQLTCKGQDQVPDPFLVLYERTVGQLKTQYLPGTIAYINRYHPNLDQGTIEAEDKLNETWRASQQGKATVEEFRRALEEWSHLHMRGIEFFSSAKRKAGEN